MKSFNLTKKKKVWLIALALLALILLAIVINIPAESTRTYER